MHKYVFYVTFIHIITAANIWRTFQLLVSACVIYAGRWRIIMTDDVQKLILLTLQIVIAVVSFVYAQFAKKTITILVRMTFAIP